MTEQKKPFGIVRADGSMELETNDRQVRIMLLRVTVLRDGDLSSSYRSTYWVKENNSWLEIEHGKPYKDVDEFLDEVRQSAELSKAYAEIAEQIKKR